jgi:hypothetical protein
MNNSYRLLKLKSGEEIITRIKQVKNGSMIIERPMSLVSATTMTPDGTIKEFTTLKKWLRYTPQKTTTIPKDFVASYIKPNDDIMELYSIEKKKDDMANAKKSKIIKPTNIQPKNKNYTEVNELMKFVNNNKDISPEYIERIMDSIENLSNEDLNEMMNNGEDNNMEFKNMIGITMMIPPEALMVFVENGLLDIEDVKNLIDTLNEEKEDQPNQSGKYDSWQQTDLFDKLSDFPNPPHFPPWNKFGFKFKKDDEDDEDYDLFGNKWSDWSPDPQDYL